MRRKTMSCWLGGCGALAIALCLATMIVVSAGCGPAGPELVPVRGQVTLDGGPWPKPGTLTFTGGPRPSQAEFDTAGNFRAMAEEKREGLLPGTYKVTVQCWEVPPTMEGPPAKSYVPQKYANPATSGLEITVESRKPQTDLKWDVKK